MDFIAIDKVLKYGMGYDVMPKKTATKLINKYKTNNPFYIAEHKGIEIIFEPLGSIYGYFNKYKRIKFIHINNQISTEIQRFTCAHELGHALLHHDTNTSFLKAHTFFSTSKLEREANTFAVELLMPDQFLVQYKNTNLTIYDIAARYGVPREVCGLKLQRKLI